MAVDHLSEIASGSFAGMAGKLVEHPFDTIKVRLQTQFTTSPVQTSANGVYGNAAASVETPLQVLSRTLRFEGLRGLYQGLMSPLAGAMAENAVLFWTYRYMEKIFIQFNQKLNTNIISENDTTRLPLYQCGISGLVAGAGAAVILTPVELVKCRVQIQRLDNMSAKPKNTFQMFYHILRNGNIFSFYRGFGYTLVREGGGGAAWFGTYEYMCRVFRDLNSAKNSYNSSIQSKDPSNNMDLHPAQMLTAGALAGVAYNVSFFPFDVMKSIVQTSRDPVKFMDLMKSIYMRRGLRGFYPGMGITMFKAVPGNAVVFFVYESLANAWK